VNITQEEFNKIEKEILSHLKKIRDDIGNSVEILRKNDKTLVKSEVCLAFIGADTFARFYEIMKGEREDDSKKRFRVWLDAFVFTEKNEEYRKYKNKIKCGSATAWELRNSLLHFYGLPKRGGACFGQLLEDEQKKLRKYIKANKSQLSRIINPYYFRTSSLFLPRHSLSIEDCDE